jgi:hypothetical protein
MSYIITTKRGNPPFPNNPAILSRVAVATLEKAQNATYSAAYQITKPERSFLPLAKVREAITESGGTITLPDGTVIEVAQTTWTQIQVAAGLSDREVAAYGPTRTARILDAFNAQEAKR